MKLEIPITEIQEFLSDFYHIKVGLEIPETNKIRINYLVSLVLTVGEVKADEVSFQYETNGLKGLLAKAALLLYRKKLESLPLHWDFEASIVTVDLKKIKQLSEILKFLYISELFFLNENILLVVNIKNKI